MPPKKSKKKSGKKGKKSGKQSGTQSAQSSIPILKLSPEHQEYFSIQVKDLEKQIEHYQRKCDYLEITNGMFDDKFAQMNEDKSEIAEHLDVLLKIRVDDITKLNSELAKLQEFRDQEKAAFEEQIQLKRSEMEDTIEQLTSDKRIKSGQLASMEEFKIQKEELMQRFEELHEQIAELDQSNDEDIYQKERAAVVEQDRLKKEMVLRVNNVSAEFRKVSNRQMAETNKKTIRENVKLSNLIRKKSERTMELIAENDRLRSLDGENRRQIEISLAVEADLLAKNSKNIKTIKYWVDECRESESQIAGFESEECRMHAERVQSDYKALESRENVQDEEWIALEQENARLAKESDGLQSAIRAAKDSLRVHRRLVERTKSALIDTENLMSPSAELIEAEIILRRQMMLSSLLELLNAASALGFGLEPRNLGKQPRPTRV